MNFDEMVAYDKKHPKPKIDKSTWNLIIQMFFESYCRYCKNKKSLE